MFKTHMYAYLSSSTHTSLAQRLIPTPKLVCLLHKLRSTHMFGIMWVPLTLPTCTLAQCQQAEGIALLTKMDSTSHAINYRYAKHVTQSTQPHNNSTDLHARTPPVCDQDPPAQPRSVHVQPPVHAAIYQSPAVLTATATSPFSSTVNKVPHFHQNLDNVSTGEGPRSQFIGTPDPKRTSTPTLLQSRCICCSNSARNRHATALAVN